ncbi:MAG: DUF4190 domain-containing protein [Clostridia bacterium]|nr:DUF4190 domain-containing protein [Clostridia bacterium]
MICKNCGFDNNDQAQFCVSCGTPLEQPVEQPNYQQPTYQQQPYNNVYNQYQQPAKVPGKGFAITAMVLGIISLCCVHVIVGILGIIFGGVAKSKGYRGGMATAGIVCGIIGVALWLIYVVFVGEIYTEMLEELMYY